MNERSHWGDFEHRIWSNFISHKLDVHGSFALAVSGGSDSMVLLDVFAKMRSEVKIKVLHFHHGSHGETEQVQFRNEAISLINSIKERYNQIKNLKIITEKNENQTLKSEADFRNARFEFFKKNLESEDILVTAHHLDDVLETALLKMIRGSSLEGISAFQVWNGEIFRPFLNVSKLEINNYVSTHNIPYMEDPSNEKDIFLRNWLRNSWLPALNDQVSGATQNLAKSLVKILNSQKQFDVVYDYFRSQTNLNSIQRSWYLSLNQFDQLRSLAYFLKSNGVHEFTSGQLEEVQKRLGKKQKELTFEIIGRKWVINASQIMLE